jgi:hypothetical protein
MLKIALVACASACAGAGGTALWVSSNGSQATDISSVSARVKAAGGMSWLQELHSKAGLDNLPVHTIKDPL